MSAAVSPWRLFPRFAILALVVVIVVNALMITLAVRSFPGAIRGYAFDTGDDYNNVLAAAAKEESGRFSVAMRAEAGVLKVVASLADVSADDIVLTATASRPLGDPLETSLTFVRRDDVFEAAKPLPALGQWVVLCAAETGGKTYHTSSRVIVRD